MIRKCENRFKIQFNDGPVLEYSVILLLFIIISRKFYHHLPGDDEHIGEHYFVGLVHHWCVRSNVALQWITHFDDAEVAFENKVERQSFTQGFHGKEQICWRRTQAAIGEGSLHLFESLWSDPKGAPYYHKV